MTKIICDKCGKEIKNDLAAVKVIIKEINPMSVEQELHYCSKCRCEISNCINNI